MRLSQSPVPEFLCWTRTSSKGPSDLKPHPPPPLSLIPVSQCCPPHKALAFSPALSSNLTPLRSPAPCLQDGSWEAVTNVLGGESSAKYKTHSHPWLQKILRLRILLLPLSCLGAGHGKQVNTTMQLQWQQHHPVPFSSVLPRRPMPLVYTGPLGQGVRQEGLTRELLSS